MYEQFERQHRIDKENERKRERVYVLSKDSSFLPLWSTNTSRDDSGYHSVSVCNSSSSSRQQTCGRYFLFEHFIRHFRVGRLHMFLSQSNIVCNLPQHVLQSLLPYDDKRQQQRRRYLCRRWCLACIQICYVVIRGACLYTSVLHIFSHLLKANDKRRIE